MVPYYCIYQSPMSSYVRNSVYKESELQFTSTTHNNLSTRTHKTKLHLNKFYFNLNKSVVSNVERSDLTIPHTQTHTCHHCKKKKFSRESEKKVNFCGYLKINSFHFSCKPVSPKCNR